NWEVEGVARVRVYGRKTGNSSAAWQQEFAVAVGGYSNFLSSQSQGATGSPDIENVPEDDGAPKSKPTPTSSSSQSPLQPVLRVLIVIGMILVAVGAYFILEQSQSDEPEARAEQATGNRQQAIGSSRQQVGDSLPTQSVLRQSSIAITR
ncbi:MAG: hypothetical protein EA395_00865, partial [Phormidium sp. GEM2.Bin31]